MMKLIRTFLPSVIFVAVGILTTGYVVSAVSGIAEQRGFFRNPVVINATTTSATSGPVLVAGASAATVYFASDGPNGSGNGTTTFAIEGTVDGTNYVDYNMLISNAANTNAQNLTRVASVDITGTSSAAYFIDLKDTPLYQLRCISVEAGTTTASCTILVTF